MYIYKMEEIIDTNKGNIRKLYDDYYPEKADKMRENIETGGIKYYVGVENNNQLIGGMGIRETRPDFSWNVDDQPISPSNYYVFSHLVIHIDHRNQGLAKGIIRMSIKFLIDIGAKKIRNHKRENIIPHTVFTDIDFELVRYKEGDKYPWVYEFDVDKADINKLEGLWSEYVIT